MQLLRNFCVILSVTFISFSIFLHSIIKFNEISKEMKRRENLKKSIENSLFLHSDQLHSYEPAEPDKFNIRNDETDEIKFTRTTPLEFRDISDTISRRRPKVKFIELNDVANLGIFYHPKANLINSHERYVIITADRLRVNSNLEYFFKGKWV